MLGAILSSIDVAELAGHHRVAVLRSHQRMASHYQSHVYADMAAAVEAVASEGGEQWAEEAAAAEIRVALRLTRRTADAELAFAVDLLKRLPDVAALLSRGAIDVRRAKVISRGTAHLPDAAARRVAERVVDEAPRLTTGQLATRVRRLCVEADPQEARKRFERAVDERRVVTEADEAGTAHLLGLDLPPDRVVGIAARINEMAPRLRRAGERRTMDQPRADIFLDLLEGRATAAVERGGGGDIQVDLATLTVLAGAPGELAGYGPVIADIARSVAGRQHGTT